MKTDPEAHPLADLFERVPKMKCKGNCGRDRVATCCGPIGCSIVEAERLEAFDGKRATWLSEGEGNVRMAFSLPDLICPHLGEGGSCTAYEARPLICRVWGTVRALACPWGCEPERWMTDREAADLFAEAARRSLLELERRAREASQPGG